MTNSAKQTKGDDEPIPKEHGTKVSQGKQLGDQKAVRVVTVVALGMGWLFCLHINRWHLTAPVVVLWLGWVAVLLSVGWLWAAGLEIVRGDKQPSGILSVNESQKRELEEEKKSLFRAIKEIEFDRDLGKMSAADAQEIMRFYRARAIDVIKELDGVSDSELSVVERVERDVAARIVVAQKTKVKQREKKETEEAPDSTGSADGNGALTADTLEESTVEKGLSDRVDPTDDETAAEPA